VGFFDPDPLLRRLERTGLAWCLGVAAVALAVRGGRPDVALGVLGGGVLMGLSYWAIRSSVTALVALVTPGGSPTPRVPKGRLLLQLAGRYALLGLLAYGMIARLRLHPVGLVLGVSSLFVAAVVEVVRLQAGARRQ
jgi:hypothetical protein